MRLAELEDDENILLEKYKDQIDIAIEKYKQNVAIYRGSNNYDENVKYVDPTTRTTYRKSANTFNYYNLWMSNNPQWAEYPKRNKSLICTTNKYISENYGFTRVVIPLIDCKIGICSKSDLWASFTKIKGLDSINNWLHDHFLNTFPHQRFNHLTYEEFMQKLKEVKPDKEKYMFAANLEKLLKIYGDAEGVMHEILDPDINNFTVTTWKQFNITGNKEVWLSAPCLLIEPSMFRTLAKEQKNATT